jgi:hypothetical protein
MRRPASDGSVSELPDLVLVFGSSLASGPLSAGVCPLVVGRQAEQCRSAVDSTRASSQLESLGLADKGRHDRQCDRISPG